VSAVLLLVDSSIAAEPGTAGPWIADAARLTEVAPPHVRFGLGVFDADFRLVLPVGTDRAAVPAQLGQVAPTERPTELYRSALEAVRALAGAPADRKALFIFSDGTAEDRAYFHQDVVSAATAAGVMISGFGYPRTAAESVALQSLRRLSEETGGVFVAVERSARPAAPEALAAPFPLLDSGGMARVDLTSVPASGYAGPIRLQLTVQTSRGTVSTSLPVDLPPAAGPAERAPRMPSPAALPAPPPRVAGDAPRQGSPSGAVWGLGAAVLAAGGAVALLGLRLRRRSRREGNAAGASGAIAGYLAFRDQPDRPRYAITQPTVRIGRQRDNDLVLEDTSVSRHHAEVRLGRNGTITLVDLDSLNGVFVNERQVKSAALADGDAVEVGDVRLLFTLSAEGLPRDASRAADPLEKTLVSRPDPSFNLVARE
jgi:hypothetical protein